MVHIDTYREIQDKVLKLLEMLDTLSSIFEENGRLQIQLATSEEECCGWMSKVKECEAENARLRKLIRCEQIEPPADLTDDQTTELAVALAYAKASNERLETKLAKWHSAEELKTTIGTHRTCSCLACAEQVELYLDGEE